jgi:hypothetical protein
MMDTKINKEILIGYCDREGLKTGKFGELYDQYYPIYQPDKKVLKKLRRYKRGLEVLIILGTWCSDSHEQVPKFLKVLDKIKFPGDNIQMICVNGQKEGGDVDISAYKIIFVPTFIFIRNDKEIGRIIEKPVRTLEEDILVIVSDM